MSDFYEDDEPLPKVLGAYQRAEKAVTECPCCAGVCGDRHRTGRHCATGRPDLPARRD